MMALPGVKRSRARRTGTAPAEEVRPMAIARKRAAEGPEARDLEPYSPSPEHLAAAQRMATERALLATFDPDDWVAFSGAEIVASGPDYAEVVRAAKAAGAVEPLIVPVMGYLFVGDAR